VAITSLFKHETNTMTEATDLEPTEFTAVEARVLACLMEKELLTPDNYPLTLNSLTLACNQKSSRDPAMNLTQGEVGHTTNDLADRELVHIEYGDRAQRIAHRMRGGFKLDRRQQAVLMLRRPQTLNELKSRTQRMADFSSVDELLTVLEQLIERTPPLAICLPKGPGQREDRYAHTLCGEVAPKSVENAVPRPPARVESIESVSESRQEERILALEQRVSELETQLRRLLDENG
jgi:hypothetical protein